MAEVNSLSSRIARDERGEPFEVGLSRGSWTISYPDTCAEPSKELALALRAGIPDDGKEHVIALALNSHAQPLAWNIVSTGTVDNCPLYSRDIFGWAIRVPGCRYVGIAHNHPSGVVTPSDPDKVGTLGVAKAGALLGLDLMWSLVVTHRSDEWAAVPPPAGQKRQRAEGDEGEQSKKDDRDKGDEGDESEQGESEEQEQKQEQGDGEDGDEGDDENDGDVDQEGIGEALSTDEPTDEPGEPLDEEYTGSIGNEREASIDELKSAVGRLLKRKGK